MTLTYPHISLYRLFLLKALNHKTHYEIVGSNSTMIWSYLQIDYFFPLCLGTALIVGHQILDPS